MNFLALVQRLRSECEIPGTTAPSTVVGQSGQLLRLVNWIAASYEDLQNAKDHWRWLRRPFTFNTVANDDSYAYTDATDVDATGAITRFSHWWAHDEADQYQCYLTASGVSAQYRLIYLPWEQFKFLYRFSTQTASTPINVSVDHQNNLVLGPKPNGIYTVTGDFQRSMQTLALDADIPEMPLAYHMLIVYRAMEKYGSNSVAAEVFARAQLESARLMNALTLNQLPMMGVAAPLI